MNILLIEVYRHFKGPDYSIGRMEIDKEYFCDTLEDTDRGLSNAMSEEEIIRRKIYGKTAIPSGIYRIDMNTVSPKFKSRIWAVPYGGKLPRLLEVKGFNGVLIHPGNTADDTSGCILVGQNKGKGRVVNSIDTFGKLMSKLLMARAEGKDIFIKIH